MTEEFVRSTKRIFYLKFIFLNMDIKNFQLAINQIAEEKGLLPEKIMELIEVAIASAYKKDYGKKSQIIKAKLDPKTGDVNFWQVKLVVDEKMIYSEKELAELKEIDFEKSEAGAAGAKVRFNPERHILVEEAKGINPEIKVNEELITPLETKADYGRIAAQTAKQVILQKIREAEREVIFNEYKTKEGEIVSASVQRLEGRNVLMNVGRTMGILPREEQIPNEFYRPGQNLRVFILKVETTPKGPIIYLSRAYPKLISKLFELEVPEISQGQVVIKSIAREPGSRSKIAVTSIVEGVDPIGAAVGQRGIRVEAVISELGGEKIDIVEWSESPERYIANSLSPAKVIEIKILPKNKALAVVPEEQLSLAIGKEGQNVRLAAKLTGWKIDVRGPGKSQEVVAEEVTEERAGEKTEEAEKSKKEKTDKKTKAEEKEKTPRKKKKKSKK